MGNFDKKAALREADRLMLDVANLAHYCKVGVKIRLKSGAQAPLVLNREQLYVHERLEKQRRETGKVRALVLKARQRGISTYLSARCYHQTTTRIGVKTFILTHEDAATKNLFEMAQRIHEHMMPEYRPQATADNANELDFGKLDSGYRVGTARTKQVGRSATIQVFHGSEVAFWPNAETHAAGVLQAVANEPGTEVVAESTANGVQGWFYDQWRLAEAGQSDFQAIFIPWFWAEDYRKMVRPDFEPTTDELEYAENFGLDPEQLQWAHDKNIELGGQPGKWTWLFHQEYPATAALAFQASGDESFISPNLIMAARKRDVGDQSFQPVCLGVDVARGGGDKTRIIDRQGRKLGFLVDKEVDVDDLEVVADEVAKAIKSVRSSGYRLGFVAIDVTGLGSGVYDILRRRGFSDDVVAVNFGSAAQNPDRYQNRRAEIWDKLREWFKDVAGVQIKDSDEYHRHIAAPVMGPKATRWDSSSRLVIEPKEQIKKRLKLSPDVGDAAALTFAQEIWDAPVTTAPTWVKDLRANQAMKRGAGFMGA